MPSQRRHACAPSSASITENPSSSNAPCMSERTIGSSSTIRMTGGGASGGCIDPRTSRSVAPSFQFTVSTLSGTCISPITVRMLRTAAMSSPFSAARSGRVSSALAARAHDSISAQCRASRPAPNAPALDFRLCAARHSASASPAAYVSCIVATSCGAISSKQVTARSSLAAPPLLASARSPSMTAMSITSLSFASFVVAVPARWPLARRLAPASAATCWPIGDFEWLHQKIVHARREARVTNLVQRVRRQGDDRRPPVVRALTTLCGRLCLNVAYPACCFDAVHDRHLAIHQDDVKSLMSEKVHRSAAVRCVDDPAAHCLKHACGDFLVDRVVLHDQNPRRDIRGSARRRRSISCGPGSRLRPSEATDTRALKSSDGRTGFGRMATASAVQAIIRSVIVETDEQDDVHRLHARKGANLPGKFNRSLTQF